MTRVLPQSTQHHPHRPRHRQDPHSPLHPSKPMRLPQSSPRRQPDSQHHRHRLDQHPLSMTRVLPKSTQHHPHRPRHRQGPHSPLHPSQPMRLQQSSPRRQQDSQRHPHRHWLLRLSHPPHLLQSSQPLQSTMQHHRVPLSQRLQSQPRPRLLSLPSHQSWPPHPHCRLTHGSRRRRPEQHHHQSLHWRSQHRQSS